MRRVLSRYNGAVNGYFICDRGRFGYEFVNGDERLRLPLARQNGDLKPVEPSEIMTKAASLLHSSDRVIGIGSPRASLEANFALKKLVGADNFYLGQGASDELLTRKALNILSSMPVRTPSLKEIEKSDATLVLGEDVTNTAPMMALALRQAVRRKEFHLAGNAGIDPWNDQAVRELGQGTKSPLYIAMPYATPLDDHCRLRHSGRRIVHLSALGLQNGG